MTGGQCKTVHQEHLHRLQFTAAVGLYMSTCIHDEAQDLLQRHVHELK